MATPPRRLNSFFRNSTLSALTASVAEQQELLRRVRTLLPVGLRDHCKHCIRKNDTLIIQVESVAQATLMRFQAPTLLGQIAPMVGHPIRDIQIRNLPPISTDTGKPAVAHHQSKMTAHHLIASAESCNSEEIKAALTRLGRTLWKT